MKHSSEKAVSERKQQEAVMTAVGSERLSGAVRDE